MRLAWEPISHAAIERAQCADPNAGRCLIENGSKTQGVNRTHVFSRKSPSYLIESLEWNWGMKEKTLNLDCKKNIFFLSSSMYQLYKERKWVLLPDEETVLQFYKDVILRRPLVRKEFPNLIEKETYQYKFLLLSGMEDIYIARQGADGTDPPVTIYAHPFNDLPIVSSHVLPKYVILHLGQLLDRKLPTKDSLMEQIPWLKNVRELFERWTSSYRWPPHSPSWHALPADNGAKRISVSHVDTTPRRRIQAYFVPNIEPYRDEPDDISLCSGVGPTSIRCNPVDRRENPRKRPAAQVFRDLEGSPRKRLLTAQALYIQEQGDDLELAEWTCDRVSRWAHDASSSEHPPSPPSSFLPSSTPTTRPSPRRSAQINNTMRKT
ncbi:hypothetical protein BJ165DRAFT_1532235 [Panaeolus papilionaceus]|nr:hypothetical protein BJ165DRAFT_1532235 [Panaeolus papilionaceus]